MTAVAASAPGLANEPPQPMRLAVVIERYDPDAGGAEKSTAQIVDALLERGHHVTLIAGSAKPDVVRPGVNGLSGVKITS